MSVVPCTAGVCSLQARVTPLDSSSCLAELRPEFVDAVADSIADVNSSVIAMPWAEYALMRYRQQVPEAPDAAAAADDAGMRRGIKRQRLQEPAEQRQQPQQRQQNELMNDEEEEQPQRSGCAIM
jgi:hypothetical protein